MLPRQGELVRQDLGVGSAVHAADVTTDYVDVVTKDQFRRSSGSRQFRTFADMMSE